jgi:iron-sulfur cluster assembly accessory protein
MATIERTESIVSLTPAAAAKISALLAGEEDVSVLRVAIEGGGCSGFQYGLGFDRGAQEGDHEFECEGVTVVVDPFSAPYLMGARVDYLETIQESGFKIENPNATASCGCGHSFQVAEARPRPTPPVAARLLPLVRADFLTLYGRLHESLLQVPHVSALLAIVIQVGVAAVALFKALDYADANGSVTKDQIESGLDPHHIFGTVAAALILAIFIVAFAAGMGSLMQRLAAGLLLLGALQFFFAWLGMQSAWLGFLHGINALALYGAAAFLAHQAWTRQSAAATVTGGETPTE